MAVSAVIREEMDRVNWLRVKSSNVEKIAYVEDFRRLWVGFLSKTSPTGRFYPATVYVYYDVPYAVFTAMLGAPSKGRFVDQVLKKGGYGYDPVV